jgi:hypothetical protein
MAAIAVNPFPTEEALMGYLGGIVDGEGSVSITFRDDLEKNPSGQWQPGLSINMCDSRAIDLFAARYGGSVRTRPPKLIGHKLIYCWSVRGLKGVAALTDLLPYLLLKKQQALLCLELQALKGQGGGRLKGGWLSQESLDKRMYLLNKCRELNGRNGKTHRIRIHKQRKAIVRTHCPSGHDLTTPESLNKQNACKICSRAATKRWQQKQKLIKEAGRAITPVDSPRENLTLS